MEALDDEYRATTRRSTILGWSPGLWESFDNRLRDVFATPGVQSWWKLRRHWHTRKFQEYVDRAIAASPESETRYVAIYGKSFNERVRVPARGVMNGFDD